MTSRPILFSAPMVRALLAGTKTQTRRIVKPQPPVWAQHVNAIQHLNMDHRWVPSHLWQWSELENGKKLRRWPTDPEGDGCDGYAIPSPYGRPGDRLWVRESIHRGDACARYSADGSVVNLTDWRWKRDNLPSIHCPRELSRITLEITGVRVERLQAISDADAFAEGIQQSVNDGVSGDGTARGAYRALWESINGPGSWDANPWVWVVEFKRVTP